MNERKLLYTINKIFICYCLCWMLFYSNTISNNHYHFVHKSQYNSNSMAIIKWTEIKQMLLLTWTENSLTSSQLSSQIRTECSAALKTCEGSRTRIHISEKSKTCRLVDIHIVIVTAAHTLIATTYDAVEKRFENQS